MPTTADSDTSNGARIPLVAYLKLGPQPCLLAQQCNNCQARYFDRRNACARCGHIGFTKVQIENEAVLRAFSIVCRAAPGISVPFVSAVVQTTDGTSVRSNIVNCDPSPESVRLGMELKLTTYSIGKDDDGVEAIAFGYEPV